MPATVTLRPNSDRTVTIPTSITNGNPVYAIMNSSNGASKDSNGAGSGSFYPNVNDVSDSTLAVVGWYWDGSPPNSADSGTFEMHFDTFSFGSATIVSVQGFIRHIEQGASVTWGTTSATVAGPTGSFGAETISTSGSITTATLASRTTRPGGGAWTQADIDGLYMGYHASVSSAPFDTSASAGIYDMWFVVTYGTTSEASALLSGTGDLTGAAAQTIFASALLTGAGDLSAGSPPSIDSLCGAAYGMAPYSVGPYSNVGPCLDSIFSVDSPASNVEELSEVVGTRLGCGEATAFITSRCSGGVACVLENITKLQWDRRLDEISEAEVEITLGGDSNSTCCICLAEVEPWCHELHIWRDGAEVWVGPVVDIMYSYSKVRVRAQDSLAWLTVRVPPEHLSFLPAPPTDPPIHDLTTVGETILSVAFESDTVTCEMDNLHTTLTGSLGKRHWDKFSSNAFEMLEDLSDTGLDFTTVGRTIVLAGDSTPFTPLILLNDEHILGEVEISKNGDLQENVAYVHFEGDLGTPASSDPVIYNGYCYGPIERLHDGSGLLDGVSAGRSADIYVASAAIAPRIMEVPPGSRLSPDTPWPIEKMVCGARVDVAILKTCFTLTQSFRLTRVECVYGNTGEQVNITLAPINSP